MANELAIRFLTEKITGLQVILQEMNRIYVRITDLDLAANVRAQATDLNQTLYALKSARNSLQAATKVVPPPEEERGQSIIHALRQLDAYVRSDQNIHMALNYLSPVATLIQQS